MRIKSIEWSNAFKRDFKRELKTHGATLDPLLSDTLASLIFETPLPQKNRDHRLTGEWEGLRECHLKPDLLLVYAIIKKDDDNDVMWLVRLGSHAELMGS
jgi:mRNA interferase YafQ